MTDTDINTQNTSNEQATSCYDFFDGSKKLYDDIQNPENSEKAKTGDTCTIQQI